MAERSSMPSYSLSQTPPSDDLSKSESDWTTEGLVDPYVGDLIRIRQLEKVMSGVSSHGQPVFEKRTIGNGRKVYVYREEVTYATVTSISLKRGIPTAYYTIIGSTSQTRKSPGGSLAIRSVLADNAVDPEYRQREVRRLAGSGPSADVRKTMTAEQHSEMMRIEKFEELLRQTGAAGCDRLFQGDTRYQTDLAPVDAARIEGWKIGAERVPSWVLSALLLLLEEIGEQPPVVEEPVVERTTILDDLPPSSSSSSVVHTDNSDDDGYIPSHVVESAERAYSDEVYIENPDDEDDWEDAA